MNPNAKWDDDMLDLKFGGIDNTLEAIRQIPTSVVIIKREQERMTEEMEDIYQRIGEVKQVCTDLHNEYKEEQKTREDRFSKLWIAVVAGIFTVMASAITAIAAIIAAQ